MHAVLQTLITDERDAFLVPVPQYPLYSAALALYGGTMLRYYLDEERDWAVDVGEVERVIADAKAGGMRVRGIVVINPGNPTGQVLSEANQARRPSASLRLPPSLELSSVCSRLQGTRLTCPQRDE